MLSCLFQYSKKNQPNQKSGRAAALPAPPLQYFSTSQGYWCNHGILIPFQGRFLFFLCVFFQTWSQTLGKHNNVTISGNCGSKSESTLVISWPKNESLYSLSLKFMNTSRNSWSLSLFTFNVSVGKISAFANATGGLVFLCVEAMNVITGDYLPTQYLPQQGGEGGQSNIDFESNMTVPQACKQT